MDIQFDNLLSDYLDELKEYILKLETLVIQDENSTTSDSKLKVARLIHSIKGTAGSYGLNIISSAAHRMEDILNQQRTIVGSDFEATQLLVNELDGMEKARIAYLNKDELTLKKIYSSHIHEHPSHRDPNSVGIKNLASYFLRILVLEDSKSINAKIMQTLSNYQVKCSKAEDGFIGLGRILNERFDAIICKNQLATIDGFSLEKITRMTANPNLNTPFIVISSSCNHVQETLNSSLLKIVLKGPEMFHEILATLKQFLPLHFNQEIKSRKTASNEVLPAFKRLLAVDDATEILSLIKLGFNGSVET